MKEIKIIPLAFAFAGCFLGGGLPMPFQNIAEPGPPDPDKSKSNPCGSSSNSRPRSIPHGALAERGPF